MIETVGRKDTMLATYFLIHDEESRTGTVCRTFQLYRNATAFLDDMEKACSIDEFYAQIASEMPELEEPIFRYSYAMIHLKWSGATFVMRRGTDDWQALVDRVGCAWTAKANGELSTVEFVIEVEFKD